jgi:hypothetical protein
MPRLLKQQNPELSRTQAWWPGGRTTATAAEAAPVSMASMVSMVQPTARLAARGVSGQQYAPFSPKWRREVFIEFT